VRLIKKALQWQGSTWFSKIMGNFAILADNRNMQNYERTVKVCGLPIREPTNCALFLGNKIALVSKRRYQYKISQ